MNSMKAEEDAVQPQQQCTGYSRWNEECDSQDHSPASQRHDVGMDMADPRNIDAIEPGGAESATSGSSKSPLSSMLAAQHKSQSLSGDQAKFLLNNSSWQAALCTNMGHLWEEQLFCDTTLHTSDKKTICAHRCVLMASSKCLFDIITGAMLANKTKAHVLDSARLNLSLPNISLETMYTVLHFIYYGQVIVSKENLKTVLKAAKSLSLAELVATCEENIAEGQRQEQQAVPHMDLPAEVKTEPHFDLDTLPPPPPQEEEEEEEEEPCDNGELSKALNLISEPQLVAPDMDTEPSLSPVYPAYLDDDVDEDIEDSPETSQDQGQSGCTQRKQRLDVSKSNLEHVKSTDFSLLR